MWTNEHIAASGAISEYPEPPVFAPAFTRSARSASPARFPIALLGVPFDNVTLSQALERIDEMIASGRPHYVVTPNIDFCVQAFEDVELRRILFDADLVVCDGTPLVWAARLLGNPLPERVAGADLVPRLIQRAAEKGHRVFFLGGRPQVTQQAVNRLQGLHPELVIAGHYSPPFRPLLDMNHEEIAERIRAARADLLLISFGCPKAEKWMAMHYRQLGVPVSIGVGATIDFLAGHVRRAPSWMQRGGLEWFFRLSQEPGRLWRRYVHDFKQVGWPLLAQVYLQRLAGWRHRASSHTAMTVSERTWVRVRASERLDYTTLCQDAAVWNELNGQHCLLDLSAVAFFDSSALATLIRLHRKLSPSRLVLLAPSPAVLRVLRRFRLEQFFHIAPTIVEAREFLETPAALPQNAAFCHPVPPLLWSGEVTASNAEEVWATTEEKILALRELGNTTPAIDLAELRFIDSTGVGLMLRARRYAQNLGVHLRFINAGENVRNVLRMARLEIFLLHS